MKITKSLLSALSLIVLFSFSSIPAKATSTVTPKDGDPTSITQELQSYLSGIDVKNLNGKNTVLVDFMMTPKGEIIVLSTNHSDIDYEIKRRLNYKTISNHDLKSNTTYTLPLVFKVQ